MLANEIWVSIRSDSDSIVTNSHSKVTNSVRAPSSSFDESGARRDATRRATRDAHDSRTRAISGNGPRQVAFARHRGLGDGFLKKIIDFLKKSIKINIFDDFSKPVCIYRTKLCDVSRRPYSATTSLNNIQMDL